MKITFKTETEVLKELELDELTREMQNDLKALFDHKPILKYELTFKEGICVSQCHNLDDINEKMVSAVTITIASI
jgi:hypothetical protein